MLSVLSVGLCGSGRWILSSSEERQAGLRRSRSKRRVQFIIRVSVVIRRTTSTTTTTYYNNRELVRDYNTHSHRLHLRARARERENSPSFPFYLLDILTFARAKRPDCRADRVEDQRRRRAIGGPRTRASWLDPRSLRSRIDHGRREDQAVSSLLESRIILAACEFSRQRVSSEKRKRHHAKEREREKQRQRDQQAVAQRGKFSQYRGKSRKFVNQTN